VEPFRSKHITRDVAPKLVCTEFADAAGDSVILADYAPYLSNYNFDNRASHCCFNGM